MPNSFAQQIAIPPVRPEIQALLRQLCDVSGMGFAALARVTEDRWIACQIEDRIQFNMAPGDELNIRMTICDDIRRTGQMVVIDSVADDAEWMAHPIPAFYGFQSYISLPIILDDGRFFGTLCGLDPKPRETSARHIVEAFEAGVRQLLPMLTIDAVDGD